MTVDLADLPALPEPFGYIAAALIAWKWLVIPAAHATLGLLRDVRSFKSGD